MIIIWWPIYWTYTYTVVKHQLQRWCSLGRRSNTHCGWLFPGWSLLLRSCPYVRSNHWIVFDVSPLKQPIWLSIQTVYLPFCVRWKMSSLITVSCFVCEPSAYVGGGRGGLVGCWKERSVIAQNSRPGGHLAAVLIWISDANIQFTEAATWNTAYVLKKKRARGVEKVTPCCSCVRVQVLMHVFLPTVYAHCACHSPRTARGRRGLAGLNFTPWTLQRNTFWPVR